MKRILLLLSLLLGLAAPALATDITVNSFTVPGYRWGGTVAKVRLYSNMAWTDSTGVPHIAGTPGNQTGFYQEINCTVTGSMLYIPQFVLPSTIDSIDHNQVRITAVIFDYRGNAHEQLFANWRIPNQPATTTWPVLVVYNASTQPPLAPTYATLTQVSAMIVSAINASTAAATTRFAPGDTANACSPRDVFFRDADGHYYGCPTSNNPAQFLLAGDPIDPSNITNQTAITGLVTPEQYGAIHDGASHPLSGRYTTLAQAQAAYGGAYSFVTSLAQEIDYAAVKAASNVALGPDMASDAYLPVDPSSTVTTIIDPSASYGVNALIGRVITLRYFNGFTESRTVVSNTATTISVSAFSSDFHACSTQTCLSACALPPQSYDCIAYALSTQGEHGVTNAGLNKPIFIPAGTYIFGNDTWLIRNASGVYIYGAGRTATRLQSNNTVFRTDGFWYSQIQGIEFDTLTDTGIAAFDIDGNVPGHPYATRGVQGNTFKDLLFDGGGSTYGSALCRQGLSGGQCSENTWDNDHWRNAQEAIYFQTGFNALHNLIIGGDSQNYPKDGMSIVGGSIKIDGHAFESTYQYTQVANGGFDVHVGEAGVGERIVITGCRTESLQFAKSSGTQPLILIGNTQTSSAVTLWQASANYHVIGTEMLKQVVVNSSTIWKLFSLTTTGTSGLVEPVWPASGTITDGTAVWTQRTFYTVDTVSIAGDQQPNYAALNNGFLVYHFAGYSDPFASTGAIITSSFTIARENLSHVQVLFPVDATAANVIITSPIVAANQVFILKKLDTSAHTVTLAGTGGALVDGGASVSISGGSKGWLAVQYSTDSGGNNFNIIGSSDAKSLNGATFAVPGPIGGGTPGTGTFTALTGTSLSITGTPISSSATGLLGAIQMTPINITSGTVGTSATTYITAGATLSAAGEVNRQIPMPDCVVRNLRISIVSTTPAAGTVAITIRKDGVDTTITKTITAGSTAAVFSDLTHSVTFAGDHLLSISLVNNDASNTWNIAGMSISYEVVRQ